MPTIGRKQPFPKPTSPTVWQLQYGKMTTKHIWFQKLTHCLGKLWYHIDPLQRLFVCSECGVPQWFHPKRMHKQIHLSLDQHMHTQRFDFDFLKWQERRPDIFKD